MKSKTLLQVFIIENSSLYTRSYSYQESVFAFIRRGGDTVWNPSITRLSSRASNAALSSSIEQYKKDNEELNSQV